MFGNLEKQDSNLGMREFNVNRVQICILLNSERQDSNLGVWEFNMIRVQIWIIEKSMKFQKDHLFHQSKQIFPLQ